MEILEQNKQMNFLFRNRLTQVQTQIIEKKGLDAILLILCKYYDYNLLAYDSLNSVNILKFANWLLFGHSSSIELEEKALNFAFNETFLIISRDCVYVFSSNDTKEFFYNLFSKVDNVRIEYDFTTKSEESNSEYIQLIKIARFLEHSYTIKKIGAPLLNKEKNNILEIEKWPLISAYGLDILGEGFFTLKHEIVDISQDLEKLYRNLDTAACNNLIYSKAYKLETTLSDFFTLFDRESLDKRLNRSEMYLNENQELEFLLLNYLETKKTKFAYLDDLPDPRVLVGVNTDRPFNEGSSSEPLYKIYFDYKIPSFHMTYENFDAITGLRFGRTFFLSTLQKAYLDHNENQELSYNTSKVYEDALFLFNIYFRLIRFMRVYQYDIVRNQLDLKNCNDNLRQEINDFIQKEYNRDELSYNYFLTEENVLINKTEYEITGKVENSKAVLNKVIVVRFEIKEVVSVTSNRKLGSVLFSDSFICSQGEIFNLTHDIIPVKFFFTSDIHLTGRDSQPYDIMQILKAESKCFFTDIEIKGLAFYHNFYNIAYLFPDSHELGFDNNQMCLFISGKLILFNNFIVVYDNSLGNIVIEDKNVEEIAYKDENKYTIIIITVKDGNKLPLAGIIKNEILVYLPCQSERMKSVKYEMMNLLKSTYGIKVRPLKQNKESEYEMAINVINENQYENLNYISNSFNLTNIFDVIGEMYEYEYLLLSNPQLVYEDYRELKESLNIANQNNNKTKIMFLFGTTLDNMKNMSTSVKDLGKSLGIRSDIIFPLLSLVNNEKQFYSFYYDSIKNLSNKSKVLIVTVQNEVHIVDFLYKLLTLFDQDDFFKNYLVLNISYAVNYNNFMKNKHKDLFTNLYNIVLEDLVNFVFIDEGYLTTPKIERNNKIISAMNSKATLLNMRSFRNIKELKTVFEAKNISKNLLNFYRDFYCKKQATCSEEVFIKFKYRVRKDLLENFMKEFMNVALKYNLERKGAKLQSDGYINLSDSDFQIALAELVKEVKSKATDVVIEKIVGNVKFLKEIKDTVEGKVQFDAEKVYKVTASHKEKKIEENSEEDFINNDQIGFLVSGQNLIKNVEYLNEVLLTLSGELPQFKPDRTKEDLTEEEIYNLNLVNFFRDLPEGWYWDGPVILDDKENRYGQHPDLDIFIKEYLVICNAAVEEHNRKISFELQKNYSI